MKKPICLISLFSLLFVGCLNRDLSEANSTFSTDTSEIISEAEFFSTDVDSVKIVRITSNRSWSAHLNDELNPIDEKDPSQTISWARLSEEAHPNVTQSLETTDLYVTFLRNFTKIPKSGVIHIYSEGRLVHTVNLSQKGAVYRLDAHSSVTEPSDDGEYVPIAVNCNTAWKARIGDDTTADAFLSKYEGFDPDTIYLRVKENEDKVAKKVSVIFSAQDCDDKKLDFTQPATRSDLKVFQIFTRLAIKGSKKTQTPQLVLYPEMIDADALETAKFYYATSNKSFDDIVLPTVESPEFPSEGISVYPSTVKNYYETYVIILGVAEGYRNTYTKVYARNWKMGTKYTYESSNGLVMTPEPPTIKTDYVQFDKATTLVAKTTCKGTGALYYLLHNASKKPTVTFYINDVNCGSRVYSTSQEFTSSAPHALVSSVESFDEGCDLKLNITSNGAYFWDYACMEQFKFKP